MGQLVVAAAGAAVGSFIPVIGTSMGWAIGSMIGGLMFAEHPKAKQQPLMDLRIGGTEYGQPIAYIRGAALTAGQYWWNTDRRATTSEGESGGKGGGTPTSSSTTYDMDALIGLSDNEIVGVRRCFDNGKLVWTSDAAASDGSLAASAVADLWDRMTVYTGAADQLPDPTYEAAVGTAQACAYRGRSSVFIQGLKLGTSGAVRNLTFEVVADGSKGIRPSRVSYDGNSAPSTGAIAIVDPNTGYIWSTSPSFLGSSVETYVTDDSNQTLLTNISTALSNSIVVDICYVPIESGTLVNEIWVVAGMFGGNHSAVIYNADTQAYIETVVLGYYGTSQVHQAVYDAVTGRVLTFGYGGNVNVYIPSTRALESSFGLGIAGPTWIKDVIVTADYLAVFSYGTTNDLQLRNLSDYTLHQQITVGSIFSQITYDSTRDLLIVANTVTTDYDVVDVATGSVTPHTLSAAAGADTDPAPSDDIVSVLYYGDKYVFGANSGSGPVGTTLYIVDPDSLVTEHTFTYEQQGVSTMIPMLLAPNSPDEIYILSFDAANIKRLYYKSDSITVDCPTVAQVVSALCLRAGLTAGQIDVTALSSITRNVCCLPVAQITGMRTPLELLMTGFFFEMTVSDKIYFRPRGGASVASIPYLDLGASMGGNQPDPLPLQQANDLEIPAQIALTYINIDNDYQTDTQLSDRLISATSGTVSAVTMALGMTPSEAKAVADTMLMDQAASTISTKLDLLGDYCRLEPTDVVEVTGADGSVFRLRLVKKTDAYPLLGFDAVIDDTSVLVSQGITSVDYTSSTEVASSSATLMELMDIPIGRDADNDPGFYVATKGNAENWPGSAVYNSVDNVDYTLKATVRESAVFGICTTTLGDWTGSRVFDEMNSVTVDVGEGTLSSTTRAAILNSLQVNAMLIGSEALQFRTATLISAGVYKLTGLLRGGRGTEWAMTGHAASERCVLLRAAGIRRIAMTNSEIGLSRYYKGVTLGRALSTATAESFTDNAVGLKPFSPVDLRMTRDGSNNITGTFQRRTRLSVRTIGPLGISIPLGEDSEAYEIDAFSDGTYTTVVRTISVTTASFSYSAADQTTDGLTPGDDVYAKVYQMSATVARGYPLQAAA